MYIIYCILKGVDIDCMGNTADQNLAASALAKGILTMDDVELALHHSLMVRMRLSHFDPEGPLNMISTDEVCSQHAVDLARSAAAQGCVLLKNKGGEALPLLASKNIAVLGPNANLSHAIAGYYGARSPCHNKPGGQFPNLADSVEHYCTKQVTTAMGVPSVSSSDVSNVASAVTLAKEADEVILVVGTDLSLAHEGHDATNMTLSPAQSMLVTEVAAAAAKPVVVVIMSAIPLDISAILANPNIGAVVYAGQPSVQTLGVADIIFGAVSPAGRMIQTLFPEEFQHELSIFDMNLR